MKNLKPAIVEGKPAKDYFICSEGNLWSKKHGVLRKMKPAICTRVPYPSTTMMIDGKRKSIRLHRVVCETFHKYPHPEGVTKTEWKRTPSSVKKLLNSTYHVNHIDHNHLNHHPSNLEWVTVKQNSKKYQQHRKSKI